MGFVWTDQTLMAACACIIGPATGHKTQVPRGHVIQAVWWWQYVRAQGSVARAQIAVMASLHRPVSDLGRKEERGSLEVTDCYLLHFSLRSLSCDGNGLTDSLTFKLSSIQGHSQVKYP